MIFFGCYSPKNPVSQRMLETEAGFSVVLLSLDQNVWRFEVVSNILLRSLSFRSQAVDHLAWTKLIQLVYSQMVQGSIPPYLWSLLWLGSSVQTILKAEIFVYVPPGRKEDSGLVSFKISANVCWNMSKIPMFSLYPHNFKLALKVAILSVELTVVILPLTDRLSSLRE